MAAGAGAGGGEAQPASHATKAARDALAAIEDNGLALGADSEDGVGWVFLEIVLALAIAIAIVWWTFPRKARGADKEADKDAAGKDGR